MSGWRGVAEPGGVTGRPIVQRRNQSIGPRRTASSATQRTPLAAGIRRSRGSSCRATSPALASGAQKRPQPRSRAWTARWDRAVRPSGARSGQGLLNGLGCWPDASEVW